MNLGPINSAPSALIGFDVVNLGRWPRLLHYAPLALCRANLTYRFAWNKNHLFPPGWTSNLSIPLKSLSEKAFPQARLWSSVSTSVRTASGSDRIKTAIASNNERFQGIAWSGRYRSRFWHHV